MARRGKFPLYFFLRRDDKPLLHRRLHINKGTDIVEAWCYPLAKWVAYTYTTTYDTLEPAFTTTEVSTMLNRGQYHLRRAIMKGDVAAPQFTYKLDNTRNFRQYMWHEDDILAAQEFFSHQHYGRPRKDGRITPLPIPSVRELRAMIRQEQVMYVKNSKGEFVPAWKAQDFS